jgi:hypothetical protein
LEPASGSRLRRAYLHLSCSLCTKLQFLFILNLLFFVRLWHTLDGPVGPHQGQTLGSGDLAIRNAGYEVAVLPGVLDEGRLASPGLALADMAHDLDAPDLGQIGPRLAADIPPGDPRVPPDAVALVELVVLDDGGLVLGDAVAGRAEPPLRLGEEAWLVVLERPETVPTGLADRDQELVEQEAVTVPFSASSVPAPPPGTLFSG